MVPEVIYYDEVLPMHPDVLDIFKKSIVYDIVNEKRTVNICRVEDKMRKSNISTSS